MSNLPAIIEPQTKVNALTNPFTLDRRVHLYRYEVTVLQMLWDIGHPERDLPDTQVWVDNEEVLREDWETSTIPLGAVVTVRVQPRGKLGRVLGTLFVAIAVIAVTLLTAWALGPAGPLALMSAQAALAWGGIAGAAIGMVGNLVVNALFPPPSVAFSPVASSLTTSSEDSRSVNFLSGVDNKNPAFETVPRVIGTRRMTPPMASRWFTEIVGDDQYLRVIYCWGYGPVTISDLRIGETPLENYSNYEIEHRYGYPTDEPLTLYTNDVYEESLDVSLLYDKEVINFTQDDIDEVSYDVTFPKGLYSLNDQGQKQSTTISFAVRFRAENSSNWVPLPTLTVSGASTSAIRRGGRFQVARGKYAVGIRRISPDSSDIKMVTDSAWTALRSMKNVYPLSFPFPLALTALRIKATDQLNGLVSNFNGVVTSIMPDWDSATGTWVERGTSNPASAFRQVLQGNMTARPLPDSRVDIGKLQEWHEFCTTNDLQINNIFDSQQSMEQVLKIIAACGRGALTVVSGNSKWSVIVDEEQSVPVQHFSPANTWDFSSQISYPDLPHALRCPFTNAEGDFKADERLVPMDPYSIETASKFETLELVGVTDKEQVYKMARYHLAQGALRRETYSFYCDIEHLRCLRGDLIRVLSDVTLWGGDTARIRDMITDPDTGYFIGMELDMPIRLIDGSRYNARVRTASGESLLIDLDPTQYGDLPGDYLVPQADHYWSFDGLGDPTIAFDMAKDGVIAHDFTMWNDGNAHPYWTNDWMGRSRKGWVMDGHCFPQVNYSTPDPLSNPGTHFSAMGIFKTGSSVVGQMCAAGYDNGMWILDLNWSGHLQFYTVGANFTNYTFGLQGPILSPNTVYHITMVVDGNTTYFYINGVMVASGSSIPINANTDGVYRFLGGAGDGTIAYQTAIWFSALTPTQVKNLYNAWVPYGLPLPLGLNKKPSVDYIPKFTHYWGFDDPEIYDEPMAGKTPIEFTAVSHRVPISYPDWTGQPDKAWQMHGERCLNAGVWSTTDWVDSNSDGLADDWSADWGGTPSIVTGNGFSGRAQRLDQIANAACMLAHWDSLPVDGVGRSFQITFKYRSSHDFYLKIPDHTQVFAVVPANTGNAKYFSGQYTLTTTSRGLGFSFTSSDEAWLEIDEVSVSELDSLFAHTNGNTDITQIGATFTIMITVTIGHVVNCGNLFYCYDTSWPNDHGFGAQLWGEAQGYTNVLYFNCADGSLENHWTVGVADIKPDTTYQFVWVLSGGIGKIYVNGTLYGQVAQGTPGTITGADPYLVLGNGFDGYIHNFGILKGTAFDAQQVKNLYDTWVNSATPSEDYPETVPVLDHYWEFDSNLGDTEVLVKDIPGNSKSALDIACNPNYWEFAQDWVYRANRGLKIKTLTPDSHWSHSYHTDLCDLGTAFTIMMTVKTGSNFDNYVDYWWGYSDVSGVVNGCFWRQEAGGALHFTTCPDGSSYHTRCEITLTPNELYHLVLSHDNGITTLYVNGKMARREAQPSPGVMAAGYGWGTMSNAALGTTIYNLGVLKGKAFSAAQAEALYYQWFCAQPKRHPDNPEEYNASLAYQHPNSPVSKTSYLNTEETPVKEVSSVKFSNPLVNPPYPAEGDLALFGLTGIESRELLITGIYPRSDLSARITAVDYNPAVYTADTEVIPPFDSMISPLPEWVTPIISNIISDGSVLIMDTNGNWQSQMLVVFQPIPTQVINISGIEVAFRTSGSSENFISITTPTYQAFCRPVQNGTEYEIKARYLKADGQMGPWSDYSYHVVQGKEWPPANVTGFGVSQRNIIITCNWNPDPDRDIRGYEIQYGPLDCAWDDSTTITITTEASGTSFSTGTVPQGTWKFMIKAVDTSGNYSLVEAYYNYQVQNFYELIKEFKMGPEWNVNLHYMTRDPLTCTLFPNDQASPAGDDFNVFDNYVTTKYSEYYFWVDNCDIGEDVAARAWWRIVYEPIPGYIDPTPISYLDYRVDGGSYDGEEEWLIGPFTGRYIKIISGSDYPLRILEYSLIVDKQM